MEVAILLFDGVTVLDAIGPYEVLRGIPGAEMRFVSKQPGPKRADSDAFSLTAEHSLAEVPRPEIVLVPGGEGNRPLMGDREVLDWLRDAHEHTRFTTSVCTGSLVLAAAGILDGLEATTHWAYTEWLERLGATYTSRRVVEQGKVVTAAGVSSGIDMALVLAERIAGPELSQAIQLAIEYDPAPPHDAGSPAKAPAEIVERVRAQMSASPDVRG
jgi:transcriptional regulator GlxA family with amidase domain